MARHGVGDDEQVGLLADRPDPFGQPPERPVLELALEPPPERLAQGLGDEGRPRLPEGLEGAAKLEVGVEDARAGVGRLCAQGAGGWG